MLTQITEAFASMSALAKSYFPPLLKTALTHQAAKLDELERRLAALEKGSK